MMENNFRFASSSVSDRGLSEKRPVNEDSFLELRDLGLFAVADGVGGAQAGDFASQMAMETLSEAFHNLPPNFDAEQALKIAIQHANQSIFNMSNELPQLASMATTIASLHVNGNIATIAHVGDSRIYRILPDGTLQRETADHSVVEEEVRAGRMTPEQALVHPSRNVISRALGAEETVDVDIKTVMVEPGTMFLLCSDGITRHIEDPELETLFGDEIEPEALCEQMKDICYSRGAEDNLTAVVVRISGHLADVAIPAQVTPQPEITEPEPQESIEEEEVTVASARSPFDDPIINTPQETEHPISAQTQDDSSGKLDDESYLLEETPVLAEPSKDRDEHLSSDVVVPAQGYPDPPAPVVESIPFSYSDQNDPPRSRWGSFFTSILLFLLGGAAGFGTLWFWQEANPAPQVPVLSEMKSSNVPLTEFENSRRLVDSDPARFLAANAASPRDAEDHYLLARAQLMTGKYVEAKRQLTLAKERLPQTDAANRKTLGAEIALGLAIADNPTVAEAFAREIGSGAAPTGDGNSNTNGLANSNAVPR